jgi:hypothetical protein
VYFCVGRTVREAKFKIVSEKQLQVIAPPFFHSGASATVVVETPSGVTVGMPASVLTIDKAANHAGTANSFCHIVNHGVLTSTSGPVFIDDGAAADAPSSSGLCFVKSGGSLLDVRSFQGLVFYEPLARSQPEPGIHHRPRSIRTVMSTRITASVGIEPFLYERPKEPTEPAKSAPTVTSAAPSVVQPGGLVSLWGSGFLQTSEVDVIHSMSSVTTAAYRVVSDNQLEVDLPDRVVGSPLLVIVNPKGATVVMSQRQVQSDRRNLRPYVTSVRVVQSGMVVSDGSGSCNYLVENGGVIARAGGSCNFFVLKGGRVASAGAGALTVFCERESDIEQGQSRGGGNTVHEVSSLSVSGISTPIEIQ